jgi:hypothetical protein
LKNGIDAREIFISVPRTFWKVLSTSGNAPIAVEPAAPRKPRVVPPVRKPERREDCRWPAARRGFAIPASCGVSLLPAPRRFESEPMKEDWPGFVRPWKREESCCSRFRRPRVPPGANCRAALSFARAVCACVEFFPFVATALL